MPTRCPQSHDPRVGGLANRTSTTAAQDTRLEPWTLVPATNAPSRPHAPNAMRGRLNPRTRAASHLTSSRKQATDVRSRVGGHVDDPSPTAVHIRCYRATSTRSRLRTKSIFVFPIGSGEPRAWTGAHRTSAIRARRSSTSCALGDFGESLRGVCPDFYFACTRETRATPQSHDDNDNGDDNCNENDNLCAIVHREVKPPQKRLAPAQTTFHAPFRPRARRNPTTPAWAGTRTARQARRHDTRVPTTRALRGATPADARQWR